MPKVEVYKTKQKAIVRNFFKENPNKHHMIKDIKAYLDREGAQVGLTTVYRCVENLVAEGFVKKYIIDNNTSACFEYRDDNLEHADHFHLKCEDCNKLIHLECEELNDVSKHILEEHNFSLDPHRTVLYGICEDCAKNHNSENHK